MGTLIVIFCVVTLALWIAFLWRGAQVDAEWNNRAKAKPGYREDRWLATRDDRGADMGGL